MQLAVPKTAQADSIFRVIDPSAMVLILYNPIIVANSNGMGLRPCLNQAQRTKSPFYSYTHSLFPRIVISFMSKNSAVIKGPCQAFSIWRRATLNFDYL